MAQAERIASSRFSALLRGNNGVEAHCANLVTAENLSIPVITGANLLEQNISLDLAEKSTHLRYPAVHVFCERLQNTLREKFRRFSGTATLVADVRVSHEHCDSLLQQLQIYVQSITDVLDTNRGNWGSGVYHAGAYDVTYGPAKRGGKNFVQSAQVRLEVHINLD
ncbi:MAG TPA: hypothetical protein VES20_23605 [Bryobacteraceae bacterium]|nr:hypothetical protein [Bryobacteraceae bacterium]